MLRSDFQVVCFGFKRGVRIVIWELICLFRRWLSDGQSFNEVCNPGRQLNYYLVLVNERVKSND